MDNQAGPVPTVCCDELVEFVAEMLGSRLKKHEIRDRIKIEIGIEMHPRSLENLLARARKLMIERSKQPRDVHMANAIEFYERIIADEDTPVQQRIMAQTRLDNLLGLERQFTVIAGSDATPDEKAAAAREALKKMREVNGT